MKPAAGYTTADVPAVMKTSQSAASVAASTISGSSGSPNHTTPGRIRSPQCGHRGGISLKGTVSSRHRDGDVAQRTPTLHFPDRSVQPHDLVGAGLSRRRLGEGGLVQAVDVLRDQPEIREAAAPLGEHVMRRVRPTRGDQPAAPVVPLPDETRIVRKGLGRGERFRLEVLPQPVGATKCRDAARSRNARPGKHRDAGVCC